VQVGGWADQRCNDVLLPDVRCITSCVSKFPSPYMPCPVAMLSFSSTSQVSECSPGLQGHLAPTDFSSIGKTWSSSRTSRSCAVVTVATSAHAQLTSPSSKSPTCPPAWMPDQSLFQEGNKLFLVATCSPLCVQYCPSDCDAFSSGNVI
jgi:hypothetical protein